MPEPSIRQWLTSTAFAAAVPRLAPYPLPAISHVLAQLRTTAVAVLADPTDPTSDVGQRVYLVAPSYALLVDTTGAGQETGYRHVRLPAPLSGAAVDVPAPVVDVDTVLAALTQPACGHLWPGGDTPYPHGWAHAAIHRLGLATGTARQAMTTDSEQYLPIILPALAAVMRDLSAITDGLTPYCGDFCAKAEARLAATTAYLESAATELDASADDVAQPLRHDQRCPDLRLTEIVLHPERHDDAWQWSAIGHLRDNREDHPESCHATIVTSSPQPTMAAAIDAIRATARAWHASRPDPGQPPTQLTLRTPPHLANAPATWDTEMLYQAHRLHLRVAAPPGTPPEPTPPWTHPTPYPGTPTPALRPTQADAQPQGDPFAAAEPDWPGDEQEDPPCCGAYYTTGGTDPYGTQCDGAVDHYPDTPHEGPDPFGLAGERVRWRGGGQCAGDPLPYQEVEWIGPDPTTGTVAS